MKTKKFNYYWANKNKKSNENSTNSLTFEGIDYDVYDEEQMKLFADSIEGFKADFKKALDENKCEEIKRCIIEEHIKSLSELLFYNTKFKLKKRLAKDLVQNEKDKSFSYLKNNVYVNKENVEIFKKLLINIENMINNSANENIEDEYLHYINNAVILSKCKTYQELYGIYLKICRMLKLNDIMEKELVITQNTLCIDEDLFTL